MTETKTSVAELELCSLGGRGLLHCLGAAVVMLLLPLLQRQQPCTSPVQLKGCACVVLQHSHLILSVQIKESGSESG